MSGATEDLFDVLSGELTALRRSVEHYGGASLSKNEARDLNKALVQAVDRMETAVQRAPQALQATLKADRDQMAREAIQAATRAAERVMGEIRGQLQAERLHFAQSAGEARRAAWRSFGGFWVWLVAVGATGAFLGLLAAYATEAGRALVRVSDMVPYACEWSNVGGQLVEQEDGSSFCLFWIETPAQANEL